MLDASYANTTDSGPYDGITWADAYAYEQATGITDDITESDVRGWLVSSAADSSEGSSGQTYAETLAEMLASNPQVLAQQFGLTKQYAPELQQLYLGLMQQYLPQYQQLAQQMRSSDRTSNMNDVLGLVPQFKNLERQTQGNNVYEMRKMLGDQIYGDLANGQNLDPEGRRLAEQYSRSADLSRGVMSGSGSANREAVAKALSGRALQTERQGKAQQFGTWEQSQRYDPFSSTMSMPNSAMTAAYGSFEQPMGTAFDVFGNASKTSSQANQASQFSQQMAYQQNNLANQLAMAKAYYSSLG